MILPEHRVYVSICASEVPLPVPEVLEAISEAFSDRAVTFAQRSGDENSGVTLRDISERVRASDLVVAVTGQSGGEMLPPFPLREEIVPEPAAGTAACTWHDLLPRGFIELSITQWEIVLAIFWKRPWCLWEVREAGVEMTPVQRRFLETLPGKGARAIFSSMAELRFLARRELHAPQQHRSWFASRQGIAFACAVACVAAALLSYWKFPIHWPTAADRERDSALAAAERAREPLRVDPAVDHEELALFAAARDKIQVFCICSGRHFSKLSPDTILDLVSERTGVPVLTIRVLADTGSVSASPIVRARALILRGNLQEALATLPEPTPSTDVRLLTDYLQVKAQAMALTLETSLKAPYEIAMLRKQRAELLDKAASPDQWADAQIIALLNERQPFTAKDSDEFLKEALAIRLKAVGPDHLDTITTRDELARRLIAAGDFERAISELRANVAASGRLYGPQHKHTLGARSSLARALSAGSFHKEAIEESRAMLELRELVLGRGHPDTLESHNQLGTAFLCSGQNAEAEREYTFALGNQRGEDFAKACINLALALAAQKKWSAAWEWADRGSREFQTALGAGSPLALRAKEFAAEMKQAQLTGQPLKN